MKARQRWIGVLGSIALAFAITREGGSGVIEIKNETSNLEIGNCFFYPKNLDGAGEGYGYADFPFLDSPYTNALEIYSMVDGYKLRNDARPIDTLGWDFYLSAKGAVTGDDALRFRVTSSSNLPNSLYAYDTANPSLQYNIPKDGSIYTINLPNLLNQTGEYAHWRLDVSGVPEPSTFALLRAAGFGWLLFAGGQIVRRIIR